MPTPTRPVTAFVLAALLLAAAACRGPGAGDAGGEAGDAAGAQALATAAEGGTARRFGFEDDAVGSAPAGLRLERNGIGRDGRWVVRAVAGAPEGRHVLAQIDDDPSSGRFPMAVADAPVLADVRVSARCRALAGEVDRAVGLVARWQGPDDYYVTRANALEDNVRLYHVVAGQRTKIGGWDGPVSADAWHELSLEIVGDHLRVIWDRQTIIDLHDGTFAGPGRAGLWTKADSVSEFDDVRIEPLGG